jgi:SAM-dependent methyltransferase
MAHHQQFFFLQAVKQFLPEYFAERKVLEIGSLNINGSIRQFYERCEYTGLDVGEGRDVDVVCFGEDYGAAAGLFDMVVSCEAMEHNPGWKKTWLNVLRLVKPDGLVVMTCATLGRRQHGTAEFDPTSSPLTIEKKINYYKNLVPEDFNAIVSHDAWFGQHAFNMDYDSRDLYFFGVGHDATPDTLNKAANLKHALAKYYHDKNVLGRY